MNAREENELKRAEHIEEIISSYPDYVQGFYNSLSYLKSERTKTYYVWVVCKIIEFLKKKGNNINNAEKCYTVDNTNAFMNSLKYRRNSDGTVETRSVGLRQIAYSSLKNFYRYMVGTGRIKSNPCDFISRPVGSSSGKEKRYLSTEEVNNILKKLNTRCIDGKLTSYRDVALLAVLAESGIRITAATEIDENNLTFMRASNGIECCKVDVIDKGDKYYSIVLQDTNSAMKPVTYLKRYLKAKKELFPNVSAVFVNRYGDRINPKSVEKVIKIACAMCGIEGKTVTAHMFRRSFARTMYNASHDLRIVQMAMHHSRPETTERYIGTNGDDQSRINSMIGSIYG